MRHTVNALVLALVLAATLATPQPAAAYHATASAVAPVTSPVAWNDWEDFFEDFILWLAGWGDTQTECDGNGNCG